MNPGSGIPAENPITLLHRLLLKVRPAFAASFIKRVLGIKRRVIETRHGRLYIDPVSHSSAAMISDNGYDPALIHSLNSILKTGDTFLDIGANEGYFSIIGSKLVGPSGQVISVEPQSRLQPVIFRNIMENRAYNVQVLQRVLSDQAGVATIHLMPDVIHGGSGLIRDTWYRNPTELIPQMSLAGLFDLLHLSKVKLAKIDVEGFEYEVILGSRAIFEENLIENIALDLHPFFLHPRGKSEDEILEFLKGCGYKINPAYKNLILSAA